jgi:UDP-N-acetylglucosamine 1-carboxyvinyltransferase
MQSKFVIEGLAGGKTLEGEIRVGGAKNAILKALPASVLFEDEVQFANVPEIEDVRRMQELLLSAKAGGEWGSVLKKDIAERFRASVVLVGPMVARTGSATFPFPGGCVLGERPIDLFLQGFTAMGCTVSESEELFTITAKNKKLQGAHISFPFVSVTATETLMLAALLAQGETVLENAAMEPEIPILAEFLNSCGAHIEGAGTSVIKITGGGLLRAQGKVFQTPPDRIEAGSFVILAALTAKDVLISGCEPAHMGALLSVLSRAGVDMEVGTDYVRVRGGKPNKAYKLCSVRTHEYPGFPTDLQAPMAVFMSQCTGEGTLLETIFDGRFRYADDLIRMGADITVMNPHKILIRGPHKLSRKDLEGPDLRAGLAYIMAAAVAEGVSSVSNAYVIDRGYAHIEERLKNLGLSIKREQV